VNTAAAVAPSSATMRPRSGRFLRMPARMPEARNPFGSFNGHIIDLVRRGIMLESVNLFDIYDGLVARLMRRAVKK